MALIKCPECGKEVSDKAKACPNCGYPISEIIEVEVSDTESVVTLDPIALWDGEAKGCKLLEYGEKPEQGYKLYTYEDIFKKIGIPTEFLMSDRLDKIKEKDYIKLSPITRSIGIQVIASKIGDFEKLIEKEKQLIYEESASDKKDFLLKIEIGDTISVSLFDLLFIENTTYYKKVRIKEAYNVHKKLIENEISAREQQKALSNMTSSMLMSPGPKPMSTSTSTMIGGAIGGRAGALYGMAKGLEDQNSYNRSLKAYNDDKKMYADKVSQYEDDIARLREELLHIEVPEDDCEKHIACFGLKTLIGVLPICLNDVGKDPDKYTYHGEYAWGYEYVDKAKEGKYWIDWKRISISDILENIKSDDIDKTFRKIQLLAFVEGNDAWINMPYNLEILKESKNISYHEYIEKAGIYEDKEKSIVGADEETEKQKDELKKKLKEIRAAADIVETRVLAPLNMTFVLTEDGHVNCTKVLDDKYGLSENARGEVSSWENVERFIGGNTQDASHIIVAEKKDGTVVCTPPGANEKAGKDKAVLLRTASTQKGLYDVHQYLYDLYAISYDGEMTKLYYDQSSDKDPKSVTIGKIEKEEDLLINKILVLGDMQNIVALTQAGRIVIPDTHGPITDASTLEIFKQLLEWTDITDIRFIRGRFIGIRKDGSLTATNRFMDTQNETEDNLWEQISQWKNIVQLIFGRNRILGLTSYGDVISTTYKSTNMTDPVSGDDSLLAEMVQWKGVAKLYRSFGLGMGLLADGKIISTKYNGKDSAYYGQDEVQEFKDVIGVIPAYGRTVLVRRDGTLLSAGKNDNGEGNVSGLRLFNNLESFLSNYHSREKVQYERVCIKKRYYMQYVPIEEEMNGLIAENNARIEMLRKEISELEKDSSKLGVFAIKEKNRMKQDIADKEEELRSIESEDEIKKRYMQRIKTVEQQEKEELLNL